MRALRSHALLLRAIPYGETDLILTLLTETDGKVSARFRGGRSSRKRASGGVEPFHTIEVALDDRGGELMTVKDTRIVTVRARLCESLDAMEAGGTALRWARELFPTRQAEARGWRIVIRLLDGLDRAEGTVGPGFLAVAGLELLASVGYALELDRCVVCARPCPAGVPAFVNASRGGIVCRQCGGRGRLLDAATLDVAREAQRLGAHDEGDVAATTLAEALGAGAAQALLALVRDAMAAHAGLDPSR